MILRPLRLATLLLLGMAFIDLIAGLLAGALVPGLPLLALGTINGSVVTVIVAALLTRFGWWRAAGFRPPAHPGALIWFLPLLIYALLPLSQGIKVTGGEAIVAVFFAGTIAFWKLAALALATDWLKVWGSCWAAGMSGTIFGLIHILALLAGAALLPTLFNVVASGLLGFHVAALYLRTETSWPAVLLYALLLLAVALTGGLNAPNLATSVETLLPAVSISALLAVIGVLALATRRRRDVIVTSMS